MVTPTPTLDAVLREIGQFVDAYPIPGYVIFFLFYVSFIGGLKSFFKK